MNGQIPNSRRTRNGRIRQVMRKVEGNVAFHLTLAIASGALGLAALSNHTWLSLSCRNVRLCLCSAANA